MSSSCRDNWERLVSAVVKREQIWQLCHKPYSRSPSISTTSSHTTNSSFSEQFLIEEELELISVSPPHPQLARAQHSVSQVIKNNPRTITQKLFSPWFRRREGKGRYLAAIPEGLPFQLGNVRRFSLQELHIATQNFSNKTKYVYHTVYRGYLADGSPVELKRYRNGGNQTAVFRFEKDKKINSIVAHPHVLQMLGFHGVLPKESFLIYPWMENGSVASCLRGRRKSEHLLNWPRRKRIAQGVAYGLAYMHYGCHKKIIHRDIKASNILLNDDLEAVIANFELAIIMDYDATHVNTSIVGTIGHMAPEYLSSGTCSEKTDVFGYGVFLFELITGQRAFDLIRLNDEDLMSLDWIKRNFRERKWELFVDPDCDGNDMEEAVAKLMQIAILCTESNPVARPKMFKVVCMLEV